MKYTAIDFETATSKFTSVCSIGLCVVEDGKVIHKKEILVRPEPFEFNEYNIKIHGITPELVWNRLTFDGYWEEILPYLENTLVIAHNCSFDINVLKKTLDMFSIEYPDFYYLCTVKLSQAAYPDLFSHKLNNLCESLHLCDFNHHHAMDDAYACAMVLERVMKDYDLKTLDDITDKFDVNVGHLYPGYVEPKKKTNRKKKKISKTKKVMI